MNRRFLLAVFGILIVVTGLVTLAVVKLTTSKTPSGKDPAVVVSKVDKDTGAVVNYYPNQNSELPSQGFILLNGQELANFLGPGQYDTVVSQIQALIQAKTGHAAAQAKVLPGTVAWDISGDFIRAKIKQDSPALQFTADIKLTGPGQAVVTAE